MTDTLFTLPGYEDLEISTQIIIAEAFKRELKVEVVDRQNNFIRISNGKITEYIKDASKTSKDSLISYFIMENKNVTKQILHENNLNAPQGKQFASLEEAKKHYPTLSTQDIVVKPNNTNYGIGISFLTSNFSAQDYETAINHALQFDSTVIAEAFISGEEHRFLIVDYQTAAVCKRVPANVIGDGENNIKRLVEIKNQDPRRGLNHKLPLEKIQLGETELELLKKQNLTPESIPDNNQQIFLRQNSNISTGGDSFDTTDDIHPSYKKIAETAASLVGASIAGIDMIIEDVTQPANHDNYSIIEMNFNPVLYIHNFPYQGKNRDVGAKILDLLGF